MFFFTNINKLVNRELVVENSRERLLKTTTAKTTPNSPNETEMVSYSSHLRWVSRNKIEQNCDSLSFYKWRNTCIPNNSEFWEIFSQCWRGCIFETAGHTKTFQLLTFSMIFNWTSVKKDSRIKYDRSFLFQKFHSSMWYLHDIA